MPSSTEDFITKGLWQMSLMNSKSKTPTETSTSTDFDFKPVFDFVASSGFLWLQEAFEEDGGVTKVLSKFVNAGEKLSVENHRCVMRFAPMVELWNEFRIAEENTKPRDTFFANIKIDVSIYVVCTAYLY